MNSNIFEENNYHCIHHKHKGTILIQSGSNTKTVELIILQKGPPIFRLQYKIYHLAKNVQIMPLYIETSNPTLKSIRLILNQQSVMVKTDDQILLMQFYSTLKQQHKHQGFNQYFKVIKKLNNYTKPSYLVQHQFTKELFRVKLYSKTSQNDRIQQENLKLWGEINHKNIVNFEGLYDFNNIIYCVLDYSKGITMQNYMRIKQQNEEILLQNIIYDILQALKYLSGLNIDIVRFNIDQIMLRYADNQWIIDQLELLPSMPNKKSLINILIVKFTQLLQNDYKNHLYDHLLSVFQQKRPSQSNQKPTKQIIQKPQTPKKLKLNLSCNKSSNSNRLNSSSKSKPSLFNLKHSISTMSLTKTSKFDWKNSSFCFSDLRKSTFHINIGLVNKNKTQSSFYTSGRKSRPKRPSSNSMSKTSANMCKSASTMMTKTASSMMGSVRNCGNKEKGLRKTKLGTLKEAIMSPVSFADQEKLLNKLKKRSKKIYCQQKQNTSSSAQINDMLRPKVKLYKDAAVQTIFSQIKNIVRDEGVQFPQENSQLNKQTEFMKKNQDISHFVQQYFDHIQMKPQKAKQINQNSHEDRQQVRKQQKHQTNYKTMSQKQQNISEKLKIKDKPIQTPQTKLTKTLKQQHKVIQQAYDSQIETVQFTKKQAQPKTHQQNPPTPTILTKQYRPKYKPQIYKQPLSVQQQLFQRSKVLNFMGAAVVNTSSHISSFDKIFWQLPLFFIYRSFYLKRQDLVNQFQSKIKGKIIDQLRTQNQQIKQAISKMIKIVIKKIKKLDPQAVNALQKYISLDREVNCQAAMRKFLRQYMTSIEDVATQYPELYLHQLQLVDAYIVHFGQNLDCNKRDGLQPDRYKTYLAGQIKILQKYV